MFFENECQGYVIEIGKTLDEWASSRAVVTAFRRELKQLDTPRKTSEKKHSPPGGLDFLFGFNGNGGLLPRRALTRNEKYVCLAAIHDAICTSAKPFAKWRKATNGAIAFEALRGGVIALQNSDFRVLTKILKAVGDELKQPIPKIDPPSNDRRERTAVSERPHEAGSEFAMSGKVIEGSTGDLARKFGCVVQTIRNRAKDKQPIKTSHGDFLISKIRNGRYGATPQNRTPLPTKSTNSHKA